MDFYGMAMWCGTGGDTEEIHKKKEHVDRVTQAEEERDRLLTEHENLKEHRRSRSLFYQEEIEKMKDFLAAMELEKEKAIEEERKKLQEEMKNKEVTDAQEEPKKKHRRSRSKFYQDEILKLQESLETVEKEKENAIDQLQTMWIGMNSGDAEVDIQQPSEFSVEQMRAIKKQAEELQRQLDIAEQEKQKALEQEREIAQRTMNDLQKTKKHRRNRSEHYQIQIEKLKRTMNDMEEEREAEREEEQEAMTKKLEEMREQMGHLEAERQKAVEMWEEEAAEAIVAKMQAEQVEAHYIELETEELIAEIEEDLQGEADEEDEPPALEPIKPKQQTSEKEDDESADTPELDDVPPKRKHRRTRSQYYQAEIEKLQESMAILAQQKDDAEQRLEKIAAPENVEPENSEPEALKSGEFLDPKTNKFSVKELMKGGKGIDMKNRELYLTDDEFQKVFKTSPPEFAELAEWKKKQLKRVVGLF